MQEGESVALNCRAVLHHDVDWSYTSTYSSDDIVIIYWRRRIYSRDKTRFRVPGLEESAFDLVISGVIRSDAGVYRCREKDGRYPGESCTELIVSDESKSYFQV